MNINDLTPDPRRKSSLSVPNPKADLEHSAIGNPDDSESLKRQFAALVNSLEQKHPIAEELKVPSVCPSSEAADIVKAYFAENNLPMVGGNPTQAAIGNEFVDLNQIVAARAGSRDGKNVAAFLYPFGKTLRTIILVVYPPIDPWKIAAGLMWKLTVRVGVGFSSSQIVPVEEYFKLGPVNRVALVPEDVIEEVRLSCVRALGPEMRKSEVVNYNQTKEVAAERNARIAADLRLKECTAANENLQRTIEEKDGKLLVLRIAVVLLAIPLFVVVACDFLR